MKTLLSIASLSLLLAAGSAPAPPKTEIVLVHGAWEEANIWQAVTPLLRKDGYRVVTVTLPGRPSSPLSPDKVSLDLYRDTILKAIGNPAQPVVLVGHSFGGITISVAAQAAPQKIKTLVYVAAYLPKDGQSLLDLGNSDKDSKIGPHLQIMKEKGIIVVEKSARADLFLPGLQRPIPRGDPEPHRRRTASAVGDAGPSHGGAFRHGGQSLYPHGERPSG